MIDFMCHHISMRLTNGKPRTIPKEKKATIGKLRLQLWALCKEYILREYGNDCYTCGAKNLEGSNCQLGHFIPSSVGGAGLRFEIAQLRIQCFRCNISLSGNWPAYLEKMTEEIGIKKVQALLKRKNDFTKSDKFFYLGKIGEMEKLLGK